MERIGIYGGTFNPPHIGHLRGAAQAIEALALDKLILIPDRIAPHKQIPSGSPTPEQRLEMIRIAASHYDKMEVSDIELRREGPSYSYITVQQIRESYPDAKIFLLMGTDMFTSFLSWRNPEEIMKRATLAVMSRGERGEAAAIEAQKQVIESMGYEAEVIENRVTAISSTQLRRLLAFRCAGEFLPEGVLDYIREHRFYDTRASWKNLPMEQLEKIVISLLNPNRVAHVLGCRDTAVDLARHWGANETDAARAGILHDITKAIDGPLQLTLCEAYGKILSDFSRKYPKTLHALTGSMVAERIFGENEEVVSAIEWHTTGKADMTLLQKIIYVADYMEPNRNFPGVENLRELAYTDMDAAVKCGLIMTLDHLKNLGDEVSPASREALDWLNQK